MASGYAPIESDDVSRRYSSICLIDHLAIREQMKRRVLNSRVSD